MSGEAYEPPQAVEIQAQEPAATCAMAVLTDDA